MSDLVSQLSDMAKWQVGKNIDTCRQAADELKRLTTLINTQMFQPFDIAVKNEAAQ